ncbi:MAG: hypothetical protein QNI92_13785 [Desulfobacterales bacterium]|nr:hypothetical protein [Desulfobacterales bacterium]MDJ0912964.1 hypothetical protein [Desulfobacterales bacterium]
MPDQTLPIKANRQSVSTKPPAIFNGVDPHWIFLDKQNIIVLNQK